MCTEMQGFLYSPALPEAGMQRAAPFRETWVHRVPDVPGDRLRGEKGLIENGELTKNPV